MASLPLPLTLACCGCCSWSTCCTESSTAMTLRLKGPAVISSLTLDPYTIRAERDGTFQAVRGVQTEGAATGRLRPTLPLASGSPGSCCTKRPTMKAKAHKHRSVGVEYPLLMAP